MPIKVDLNNISFIGRALEFIETYNFPTDLLEDVVRHPQMREMDPHSKEVGYPVVRCRRGDITVVLGIQDPRNPAIIFVYLHTPDEGEHSGGGSRTPGGASGSKLPTGPKQLKGYLYAQGCTIQINGRGHYNVYYKGHLIGAIAGTGNSDSIKNDFTNMRRRIAIEKAKEELATEMKEMG